MSSATNCTLSPADRAEHAQKRQRYQRQLNSAYTELAYAGLKAFAPAQQQAADLYAFIQAADKILKLCKQQRDNGAVIAIYQWICGRLQAQGEQMHSYCYLSLCSYALINYKQQAEEFCRELGDNVLPLSRVNFCTQNPNYKCA